MRLYLSICNLTGIIIGSIIEAELAAKMSNMSYTARPRSSVYDFVHFLPKQLVTYTKYNAKGKKNTDVNCWITKCDSNANMIAKHEELQTTR